MTSISPVAFLRLATIVLGTTLALTACGGHDPASPAQNPGTVTAATERVVNFSNWPDYIAPGLVEQFTAETGIRVNYSTFDGNEMLETKLLTGNSGYDGVVPSAAFLQRAVAAGGYQPITRARLSNYGNLDQGTNQEVASPLHGQHWTPGAGQSSTPVYTPRTPAVPYSSSKRLRRIGVTSTLRRASPCSTDGYLLS